MDTLSMVSSMGRVEVAQGRPREEEAGALSPQQRPGSDTPWYRIGAPNFLEKRIAEISQSSYGSERKYIILKSFLICSAPTSLTNFPLTGFILSATKNTVP